MGRKNENRAHQFLKCSAWEEWLEGVLGWKIHDDVFDDGCAL